MYTLSEIFIYPVKSLGGIALDEALVQPRGLQFDRRWMLTDPAGLFVTQREIARMALLATAVEPPFLRIFRKENPADYLLVPLEPPVDDMEKTRVQIFSQTCTARRHDAAVNGWFSDQLGQPLQLVFMPDTTRRPADGRYAPRGQHVSFADGFPILIIGQASLDALNRRLSQALPMNRFRPNLVFTGGEAHAEDSWKHFRINNLSFSGVKPCGRCIIPTTDQNTAERGAEPLKTLATYRRSGNKILFGQNVVWLDENREKPAVIRRGDPIFIESKPI